MVGEQLFKNFFEKSFARKYFHRAVCFFFRETNFLGQQWVSIFEGGDLHNLVTLHKIHSAICVYTISGLRKNKPMQKAGKLVLQGDAPDIEMRLGQKA